MIEHNRRRMVDEQMIRCSRDGGIGTTTAMGVRVSETKGGSGVGDDDDEFTFASGSATGWNNSEKKHEKETSMAQTWT